MGRRSNGEGSISQRKDGSWQAALQVDGVRRTVYGKTRREAAAKLQELRRQATSTGCLANPKGRTLNDLLDAWLESKAPYLKPRTLADYEQVSNLYLRPTMGQLPLSKVTPQRVQRLYATLQERGYHRAALKVHRALSQVLALAVRWGWLTTNATDQVDAPRYRPQRRDVWTPDQLQAFLEGTRGHWLHPLWTVAVCSGCRLGELLALTWDDVDLEGDSLTVSKAAQHIGGEWVVTEPKTQAGIRCITLPSEAVAALKRQRVWQAEQRLRLGPAWAATRGRTANGAQVFTNMHGGALNHGQVAQVMRAACDRLGLPRLSPHGLRHLHASLLLAEGLPLPEVSARLGHASSAITASVYSHAVRDDTAATAAISRALAQGERGCAKPASTRHGR